MIDLRNKNPKILVIGDLMVDHYLWGECKRISPEAPVQVINVEKTSNVLGGAGNVINNLKSLGANVDIISVVGDCVASKELVELLTSININTKYLIKQKDRITSKKSRIIASQQQVIRYDRESNIDISSKSQKAIVKTYKKILKDYEIVLISDYGKGIFTYELTQSLISIAKDYKLRILIDPKGLDYRKYKGAYLLTPNKKEASEATKITIKDNETLVKSLLYLKKQCNLEVPLITLSEQGIAVFKDELNIHPTAAREVYDVTGAGDTILASLGFALSCNISIDESIKFANLAAGVVVGKIGSATTTLTEITEYELSINKPYSDKHIKTWDEINGIVTELKNKDKSIVFTNGCFDILHSGHVKYLEKAKKFGDILILGLNSDNSTKRLKGENRPINSQDDRAYILASLEVVDYVVIFDEDTPLDLIKLIQPEVLVKGGDYKNKKVVGQDIAKELKLVEFFEGKNTSKAIEKIKNI